MKGLLKSLKYISHMFDEKEPEMQIGLPTDVKHVAHIGMDGPSANKPSWMNEFNSAPELSSMPLNGNPQVTLSAAGNGDSLPPLGNEKQKKSRRKQSVGNGSPVGSPKDAEKQSRRHRSSNLSMESPGRDPSSHGRRHRNSSRGTHESSSQELPDIPKKSRRKKLKESSGGSEGSTSSTISKCSNSLPDIIELESQADMEASEE
ncbi:CRIB domain-containing protein RIC5-like [Durio zibethinus]|uniref:CRIB domain-containing protein RIC5-like n=1 Tax=Durio zibethinus TaxID=66656 RepID=A0A6P5Z8I9_DURZI|nr:CRIB domain-containing protein RIC5-like [Durio zibethinus]